MVIFLGGCSLIVSSVPEARMLVSFFPLAQFTSRSPGLECSPITIPSYTSSATPTNKVPRGSMVLRANAVVLPGDTATSRPFSLASPAPLDLSILSYDLKMAFTTALPCVSFLKAARTPMRSLEGASNTSLTRSPISLYSPMLHLSSCMRSITAPEYSWSTSMVTSSTGSSSCPVTLSFTVRIRGGLTQISYFSRRISSMRIPSCSSPRACTSNWSESVRLCFRMMVTLFSTSFCSRALICELFKKVPPPPAFPLRGPSLAPKDMQMVGGVTGTVGRGSITEASAMVSDTPTASAGTPASITTSPACAKDTSSRSVPLRMTKMLVMGIRISEFFAAAEPSSWSSNVRLITFTFCPTATLPLTIFPVTRRPRYGSVPMLFTLKANGRSSMAAWSHGAGMWSTTALSKGLIPAASLS
mmetsp:Transcript_21274/g.42181  ORF Transcript_21274/g.42181 Transcript_21274/m.42181 type:complete len:415 (+) Transcript_21274:337-1581(+)